MGSRAGSGTSRWHRIRCTGCHLDFSDEPVSETGHRLNVLGGLRRVRKRLPELVHRCRTAFVEVEEDVARPQRVTNLLTQHRLPGALDQKLEQRQRLTLDLQSGSKLPQLAAMKVGFV